MAGDVADANSATRLDGPITSRERKSGFTILYYRPSVLVISITRPNVEDFLSSSHHDIRRPTQLFPFCAPRLTRSPKPAQIYNGICSRNRRRCGGRRFSGRRCSSSRRMILSDNLGQDPLVSTAPARLCTDVQFFSGTRWTCRIPSVAWRRRFARQGFLQGRLRGQDDEEGSDSDSVAEVCFPSPFYLGEPSHVTIRTLC